MVTFSIKPISVVSLPMGGTMRNDVAHNGHGHALSITDQENSALLRDMLSALLVAQVGIESHSYIASIDRENGPTKPTDRGGRS